jgi:flagellar protein FlgJ
MFDESDVPAGQGAGGVRMQWSRAWERFGPVVVGLLLFAIVGLLLAVGVGLFLAAGAAPVEPADPTGSTTSAGPTPVAFVAVRTSGSPLNERSGPSTYNPVHGHVANGSTIGVLCQVYGQRLAGAVTTSAWWEVDSHGWYISDAYLEWGPVRPAMPWCGVSTHRAVTTTVHTGSDGLSIRSGPSADDRNVGTVPSGTVLTIACRSWGSVVSGTEARTASWSKLGDGQYVSDAYLHWSPEQPFIPWCGEAPQTVPPATTSDFIARAVAPAQASMDRYKVPASVTIAQAILESGAGVSTLTRVDHSVFGMKCFGDPGPVAVGCRDYATHECDSHGGCYATHASFRAYRTEAESYADHGLLLSTVSRYRPAFAYTDNPDKFARALQKAGYATSTKYADNLIALMHRYDLYQYDRAPDKSPARLAHAPQ